MYRTKTFSVRPTAAVLADIDKAGAIAGDQVTKVFVADGDALVMPMETWAAILAACQDQFPAARRISCYATADNLVDKGLDGLRTLRDQGLTRVYVGPESGDEATLRRLAKGPRLGDNRDSNYLFDRHDVAAQLARQAGIEVSAIFLLGAGGVARTEEHAAASARLATAMDPHFLAALTLTIVPGTPLARTAARTGFELPDVSGLLRELRTFVAQARPTDALFRTNHASNYLPLGGRLPRDRERIVATLDAALDGRVPLRPEWSRGL
jgi:radical SAM superfamily enzyme YgiQ (UPF0313 family)